LHLGFWVTITNIPTEPPGGFEDETGKGEETGTKRHSTKKGIRMGGISRKKEERVFLFVPLILGPCAFSSNYQKR